MSTEIPHFSVLRRCASMNQRVSWG